MEVGAHSFEGCISLTGMVIPTNVTTIGDNAFNGCTQLSSFEVKSNVLETTAGSYYHDIFKDCKNLKEVKITGQLKKVPSYMFWGANYLESVSLPSSIKEIGTQAFDQCGSLKTIKMPNGVTTIGSNAFRDCTSLDNVTLIPRQQVFLRQQMENGIIS